MTTTLTPQSPVLNAKPHCGAWIIDEEYEVLVNKPVPSDLSVDIFNRIEYYNLHVSAEKRSFYYQLYDFKNGRVCGVVHATEIAPGVFRSPHRGTYGAFEMRPDLAFHTFEAFIIKVEEHLRSLGAKSFHVALPPLCYHEARDSGTMNIFFRRQFQIENVELSYGIPVSAKPFLERIDYGNVKRLRKCEREQLKAVKLSRESYQAAYDVIVANRQKKNYPVTMSWEAIDKMVDTFPDNMLFFGVFAPSEEMIASSICIRINSDILYVFYWGETPGAESSSPVTYLAQHIYNYAHSEGCRVMDIGISTLKSEPNAGLIRYKRNIGCESSPKMNYVKHFEPIHH